MQRVLSSKSRQEQIVADILLDMETRACLKSDLGNAHLVSDNIYNACNFYDKQPINPKYYEKMSELLDMLILKRKAQALAYEAYLARVVELANQAQNSAPC
jgi:hypothetical protein